MVRLLHSFPDSFFVEEEKFGFHIDQKRKEIWAVELDMLFELDRVCKKLSIPYFLDGGTLLGAARDGHFIPWDDDIDVSMLREDYDRFVQEAPAEFNYPFFLQTGYTENDYFRGHCQLRNSETCAILPHELNKVFFNQGIFLDIFVLDYLFPEKIDNQYRERNRIYTRWKKWHTHDFHPNPIRWCARCGRYLLYKIYYHNSASLYKQLEDIFRSKDKSEFVDYLMYNSGPEKVHYLKRSWYEETVCLPFEGKLFPAPKGYLEYLRCYYGADCMTPKNTSSEHNIAGQVIYDTNRPYTEVIKELNEECSKKS